MSAVGVIPARYWSTRFPGKPLVQLFGTPIILHTYRAAKRSKLLKDVYVATDHEGIFRTVVEAGGKAVMTSEHCKSGTDRIVEALPSLDESAEDFEIVVNVQGDEPLVSPDHIDKVVHLLLDDKEAVVSTICSRIHTREVAENPNVVKCIQDSLGSAIYFSRALIPSSKANKWDPSTIYRRHIGLYGFRRQFLTRVFPTLEPGPLEICEDLEQLRILEAGYKIKVGEVGEAIQGIDTEEDLRNVERLMGKVDRSN